MITIKKLEQTSVACPTQFHGVTDKDEPVYIRFRYGRLSMEISRERVFSEATSDGLDGCIGIDEIKRRMAILNIVWPDEIPFNEDYFQL